MSYRHFVPLSSYDWSFGATVPLPWNATVYCLIAAVSAIPMYMTIELTFQLYTTFKKRNGLYFWSILITAWGLTIRQIGRIAIYFLPGCNHVFTLLFAMGGWCATVTGFAVVLYARLHLVVHSRWVLHLVLAMIIIDALIFHIPTMIAQIGVVTKTHKSWSSWYPAMEQTQITGFAVQESIIASTYIWAARKTIQKSYNFQTNRSLYLLIIVQVFAVLAHIPLIALAFADYFVMKASLQSLVYAIKLKLEFVVLNQLLSIVKEGSAALQGANKPPARKAASRSRSETTTVSGKPGISQCDLSYGKSTSHRPLPTAYVKTGAVMSVNEKANINATVLPVSFSRDAPAVQSSVSHDDAIRPCRESEYSFADLERQYLGQYGLRN